MFKLTFYSSPTHTVTLFHMTKIRKGRKQREGGNEGGRKAEREEGRDRERRERKKERLRGERGGREIGCHIFASFLLFGHQNAFCLLSS